MAWQFLQTIGVSQSRIRVTGDEAIEAAYVERRQELGTQIGVNFRLRTSAETTDCELETVKSVLQQFAAKKRVSFVPVPIAVDSSTSDHRSIMRLLSGVDDETDGGAQLTSPAQVIAQVGHCRILVTCAYHAAVFALAQGIPVIGLAKSPYFTEKFLGLKNQFGVGCEVIQMTATDFSQRLDAAMEFAWASGADIRGQLHQAALRQMKAVCDSYEEVKKLVRQSTQNLDARERNMTSVIGSIAGKSLL
jgi:colanic acid/amylovoran biosynthesis protein